MQDWLAEARGRFPPEVSITVYDESWTLIEDRINLLLKNGVGGLLLVVGILFLFLNGRVAFWVTVGIPVSFMATLAIVYLAGGSINMISLFALIMALGIIVDDAIVVGEDALTHYQTGEGSLEAAEGGARRMLAPVMSSSLTTIAAFIPLFAISGLHRQDSRRHPVRDRLRDHRLAGRELPGAAGAPAPQLQGTASRRPRGVSGSAGMPVSRISATTISAAW